MLGPKQVSVGGAFDNASASAVAELPNGSNNPLGGAADAIPPHSSGVYYVNTNGVDAMTIAAPAAGDSAQGGDDGKEIIVISQHANAHTITFTGGTAQDGAGHTTTATFAAQLGASIKIKAFGGKWIVLNLQGVTMTA